MSQVTCDREVEAAGQVPRGTSRVLTNLILGLLK